MDLLSGEEALADRLALLESSPDHAPLRDLAARLRAATGAPVPEPDPLDGGAAARVLILLETPGPRIALTGIVSLDNPSGTSANLRRALAGTGLPRREVLVWNAVPWVIHAPGARNRAPRAAELREGLRWLPPLLDALPRLRAAVLAGRVAARAEAALRASRPGVEVIFMPHPSPTFVCTSPENPGRLRAALARAAALLDPPPESAP